MPSISHVELSDTFNKQRQTINELVDYANGNAPVLAGNGITKTAAGVVSVKKTGDGLQFDSNGNLVGNDAYPNLLTQVVLDTSSAAPAPTSITSTTITFPAFSVIFDSKVYYGKKISDFTKVDVPQTTMTVESGEDGAVFVYVDTAGEIHQSLNSVSPQNSSTQCLLGSYFRINNQIQTNSWAYTPWNGSTSKDTRFISNGAISGGLIGTNTASTLARGAVSVVLEGVNAASSVYTPNYKEFTAEAPYSTKKLWPGYDASVSDSTTLDTTHIYNITDGTVDDISSIDGYIVLIPGLVAPTGQDVYLMAMSPKVNGTYTQIYNSLSEAVSHIYGLQLSLGNVASRVVWLKQSIVVKIGATSLLDPGQISIVGEVPNVLGVYSAISSGGAGSRVAGVTIKDGGVVIGSEDSKTILNFASGFTVLNTSENSVDINNDITPATYTQVNTGTNNELYITPYALSHSDYATKTYVGKMLQQVKETSWPSGNNPDNWPHTIFVQATSNYSIPNTIPNATVPSDRIFTWEVVIQNTTNSSINLTWPNVYQPFNNETLPISVAANTSLFMMMRMYSSNFVLVSVQGNQSNSLL